MKHIFTEQRQDFNYKLSLTLLGLWSGADFETQNLKICTEDY